MKFHFELLTRRLMFYFSTFDLLTRNEKNEKIHLELLLEVEKEKSKFRVLTRSWKIKCFSSSN